jgi:hypothetical protein
MSENIDLTFCITFLKPNSKFELNGNTYNGLIWLSDDEKPTEQELIAVWPKVVAAQQTKEQAKLQARLAAQAKLEALGLTVEDLQALGL